MKIAIDFDGTISDHLFPEIGEPVPGAFLYMHAFKKAGAELILWTMRSDGQKNGNVLTDAVEFCRKFGIEFHGINRDPDQDEWTSSPKAYAHVYIDDAAFGCPLCENPRAGGKPYVDWAQIGPQVLDMIAQRK